MLLFENGFCHVLTMASDPPLEKFAVDFISGKDFGTPATVILPGETRRFNVTVAPVSETPLQVWADGYQDGYPVTESSSVIRVKIGNQSSDYQLDGDSYARDPGTEYVWTQMPHPQC